MAAIQSSQGMLQIAGNIGAGYSSTSTILQNTSFSVDWTRWCGHCEQCRGSTAALW